MKEDSLSISALAERMGIARTAVRRIFDARNTSITFRSMNREAQAVGLKIKLVAESMSRRNLEHWRIVLRATKAAPGPLDWSLKSPRASAVRSAANKAQGHPTGTR